MEHGRVSSTIQGEWFPFDQNNSNNSIVLEAKSQNVLQRDVFHNLNILLQSIRHFLRSCFSFFTVVTKLLALLGGCKGGMQPD